MKTILTLAAGVLAAGLTFAPGDASAQWRGGIHGGGFRAGAFHGGWRGGWGGGFRPAAVGWRGGAWRGGWGGGFRPAAIGWRGGAWRGGWGGYGWRGGWAYRPYRRYGWGAGAALAAGVIGAGLVAAATSPYYYGYPAYYGGYYPAYYGGCYQTLQWVWDGWGWRRAWVTTC